MLRSELDLDMKHSAHYVYHSGHKSTNAWPIFPGLPCSTVQDPGRRAVLRLVAPLTTRFSRSEAVDGNLHEARTAILRYLVKPQLALHHFSNRITRTSCLSVNLKIYDSSEAREKRPTLRPWGNNNPSIALSIPCRANCKPRGD
jgi:hypothetical protein